MIEIRKVHDEDMARSICARGQLEWKPEYHVIATIEGEKVLISAVFVYWNEIGEILVIDGFDGDLAMLDGLCRAILNIMDINGVKEVYLPSKYADLALKIGFRMNNDRFYLPLEGFFKCGCCGNRGDVS